MWCYLFRLISSGSWWLCAGCTQKNSRLCGRIKELVRSICRVLGNEKTLEFRVCGLLSAKQGIPGSWGILCEIWGRILLSLILVEYQ
ncbi:hypothetical protein BY996DRAFT_7056229 [Phakopsora pachyrhizi]|nr:hypothetical protein BY996DRAFT_7056229 [Phakopsora pachyrhizi]